MIETKTELLTGKSTLIKNKQFYSSEFYTKPFFERMDPFNPEYVIQVKKADQISGTEDNPDTVYNRVHIQAILPKTYYYKNDCQKVVGFIYGLDTKTPVVKFYIADIDGDGNLYSFDLDNLRVAELEDCTAIDYAPIKELMEKTDTNAPVIEQMKKTCFTADFIPKLGEWVNFALNHSYTNEGGKVKLATTIPVDGYKSLKLDKDSDFYVDEKTIPTLYDVYEAFAYLIRTDKDIMNNFEKTILLSRMLGL